MGEAFATFTAKGRTQIHLDESEVAEDASKEIVKVVRDPSRELSYRFHLLRLAEPLLQIALPGEVPRVPDAADEISP